MTPYYADEQVTIYHGDMRDAPVLPVDHIVTDPPYARRFLPLWSALADCACGGPAIAAGGSAAVVSRAVREHNETQVHRKWRRGREQ